MVIEVNGIYTLEIPRADLNDKISYTISNISPKYRWWKEINGKKVKVKAVTRLVSDYYNVVLIRDYNQPFYVPRKYLAVCDLKNQKCSCDSYNLFWWGCLCGAFKLEQELEKL